MSLIRHLVLVALTALTALPDAWAQPRPADRRPEATTSRERARQPAADKVTIELTVVHATNDGTSVDPRLASLQRQLAMYKYSNYEVLSQKQAQLSEGGKKKFSVEGGKDVSITLLGTEDGRARCRIVIESSRGKLVDTTVSIRDGRTLIVGGTRHEGGVLLLPITASF